MLKFKKRTLDGLKQFNLSPILSWLSPLVFEPCDLGKKKTKINVKNSNLLTPQTNYFYHFGLFFMSFQLIIGILTEIFVYMAFRCVMIKFVFFGLVKVGLFLDQKI
jgi:hypothetical protein